MIILVVLLLVVASPPRRCPVPLHWLRRDFKFVPFASSATGCLQAPSKVKRNSCLSCRTDERSKIVPEQLSFAPRKIIFRHQSNNYIFNWNSTNIKFNIYQGNMQLFNIYQANIFLIKQAWTWIKKIYFWIERILTKIKQVFFYYTNIDLNQTYLLGRW